jgi:hypothetical protein
MATAAVAFTFDEARHLYIRSDGVVIPSTTQVLKQTGWANYDDIQSDILERASARGTAVHAITEFIDTEMAGVPEEEIDLSPINAEYLPYVLQWLQFKRECDVQILDVEQQAIGTINGMPVGRKYDRRAIVNGRESVLEIKTGESKYAWWGLQLAGYDSTMPQCPNQLHRDRYAVQLRKNSTYQMHKYEDEGDYQAFAWSLAVVWLQLNRGYKLNL